jgi:hypothetical protein
MAIKTMAPRFVVGNSVIEELKTSSENSKTRKYIFVGWSI